MKLGVIVLLFLSIIMLGCKTTGSKLGRYEIAKKAKVQLVGMSKREVLLCAGVPHNSFTDGDLEFFTYYSGGDSSSTVVTNPYTPEGVAVVNTKQRNCKIDIIFESGIATRVEYSGRTGGLATKGEQCAYVLERCVNMGN